MSLIQKLENILEREGLLVKDKFNEWLELSKSTGQTIDKILSSSGYLTEKQMLSAFSECLGIPVIERLADYRVPEYFVSKVSVQFARHHNLIAIGEENGAM